MDQWSRRVLHTNMYTYHLTVLMKTWLLVWAYYAVLHAPAVRRWLLPVGLVFTGICLLDAFVWSGLAQTNVNARAAQVIVMLLLFLAYFDQIIKTPQPRPWRDFMFIVTVGHSFYYVASLAPYLLQNLVQGAGAPDDPYAKAVVSVIIGVSYDIPLLMMTWALWRETRTSTQVA